MSSESREVTRILEAAGADDSRATAELLPIVYAELRRLAQSWLGQAAPGQTLQPTALVHEAFVRLVGRETQDWKSRGHFFFAASRAMRDILVERARAKGRIKRGGGRARIDLERLTIGVEAPDEELLALDEVLTRFEAAYPWEHRIVMLRFFGGMTNEETANAMQAPLRTVERDWRFARVWLHEALSPDASEAS